MLNELIQHLINYQYKSPLITQIAILAAILFVAWLLQFMLRRIARALKPHLPAAFWKESAIKIARSVTFWLTTLLLLNLIIIAFRNFWQKLPLVEAVNRFAVVWLIYRFVATLLEVTLEKEKARFWNRKVLFPLAIILGLLNVFDLVEVILNWGFQIGSIHWEITVGAVLLALGIVAGFVLLSRVLGKFLIRVLPDAGLENPMANTVSKIVAYTVITFGVLIALGTIGIDLTTLTVVAGGLSVGVAFGLQEVVNNFVSGFILLFDRSLVPGDVVQVGSNVGEVEKVGIRSTTVRTRDNVELLIPNSHLLTQVVTNLTHTDELVRLHIPVGVSYNANPRQVEAVLLDAVRQNPAILEDPAPSVLFRNFGESSLDFDLLVWTGKAIQSPTLTSDLRYAVWDALAEHNIEIPFPQRDIHIKS